MSALILDIGPDPESPQDGLIVSGIVDGRGVVAHAWRSHLYEDHEARDELRSGRVLSDEDGVEYAAPLIPVADRLDSDEKRVAYLVRLLEERATVVGPLDLAHLTT